MSKTTTIIIIIVTASQENMPMSISKHKKTVTCLAEEICMSDKLHSAAVIALLAVSSIY